MHHLSIRSSVLAASLAAVVLGGCGAPPPVSEAEPVELVSWDVGTHVSRFAVVEDPDLEGWSRETIRLPGLPEDLVFEPKARLVEHSDGIATLEGFLTSASDPRHSWRLTLDFAGFQPPGPGGGYPNCRPEWRTYALASGELVGLDACRGGRIRLLSDLPALQLGEGADGFGPGEGALSVLFLKVVSQPVSGPRLDSLEARGVLRLSLRPEAGGRVASAPAARELGVVAHLAN